MYRKPENPKEKFSDSPVYVCFSVQYKNFKKCAVFVFLVYFFQLLCLLSLLKMLKDTPYTGS